MRKTFCDGCDKEIDYIDAQRRIRIEDSGVTISDMTFDLCLNCKHRLNQIVDVQQWAWPARVKGENDAEEAG